MDRLGLAAESVEPGMVEIGGGEAGVPGRVEAPGAVIEALAGDVDIVRIEHAVDRSEEHTSELQSLMRISYAVFCLKKKHNEHAIHIKEQYTNKKTTKLE